MKKVCLISLERSAAGRNLRPAGSEGVIMYRKSHAVRTFLCLLLTFVFMTVFSAQSLLAASDQKPSVAWPEAPAINSGAACLMDADTNAILFGANMDEQRYPASITKVMTALLVAENKQPADQVTFGEQAVSESIPGNARINVQLGETISVEDALHAILLASANEVCTQLAIDIAGSVEAFADMMNERAAALGCTNTHFTNPNGLPDPNHYTTAHDMALIMQEAIKNETFLRVESDLSYTIPPTNMTASPRPLQNHHVMLFQEDPTYGYQGAFAGKTGYTDEAHNTLVTAAKRNNVTLICVVLTCDNLDYITDTRSLFDYGFQHFTHHTLKDTKKESLSGTISLPKDAKLKSATYTDPDDAAELESFTRQYFYDGHPIGTAEVSSKKASSSDSSSSSSETAPTGIVTPEANRDDASSTGSLSSPLYILLGLNAAAILVLIFAVIQRSRKKRKRRRRKNHRK